MVIGCDLGIRIRMEAATALGQVDGAGGVTIDRIAQDRAVGARGRRGRALPRAGSPSAVDPLAAMVALFVDEDVTWLRSKRLEALVALKRPEAALGLSTPSAQARASRASSALPITKRSRRVRAGSGPGGGR